jgi:hypothetical protein
VLPDPRRIEIDESIGHHAARTFEAQAATPPFSDRFDPGKMVQKSRANASRRFIPLARGPLLAARPHSRSLEIARINRYCRTVGEMAMMRLEDRFMTRGVTMNLGEISANTVSEAFKPPDRHLGNGRFRAQGACPSRVEAGNRAAKQGEGCLSI